MCLAGPVKLDTKNPVILIEKAWLSVFPIVL